MMNWTQISFAKMSKTFPLSSPGKLEETHNLLSMTLFLSRMILTLLTLMTAMIRMDCEVTESMVFHPMDWIHNSISPWILTTTIDLNPYKNVSFGINQYAVKVKQSLTRYADSFQSNDPRYSLLLNMMMDDDINSVLNEITLTQIETLNLVDKYPLTQRL